MRYRSLLVGAAACVLAALGSGCSTEVAVGPPVVVPVGTGRLTVLWTVEGAADPAACGAVGADQLELLVFDASGAEVGAFYGFCEDFAISVDLPPGLYSAEATLVDPNLNAVSTTLPLQDIELTEGTELTIDTDFPPTSIL